MKETLTTKLKIAFVFYGVALIGIIFTIFKPEWSLCGWLFNGPYTIGVLLQYSDQKEKKCECRKYNTLRFIALWFGIGILLWSIFLVVRLLLF